MRTRLSSRYSPKEDLPSSRLTRAHQPCPDCGSSDALSYYDDGHTFCFSCNKHTNGDPVSELTNDDFDYTYQYVATRGLTQNTMEKFDILTKVDPNGTPVAHGYKYPNGAIKIRNLLKKEFHSKGEMSSATLFGADKFSAGSSRSITICEGELDAASVFQLLGSKYPSVSVRSASSARKDCAAEFEYLNSFESIYLCFDGDEPGQRAAADVAGLFNFNKVYHVQLTKHKDPNEYLQAGDTEEFKRVWYNAKKYLPEGIISSNSEVLEIFQEEKSTAVATYPWATLQELTKGIRYGEVVLLTAMEGVGKTEIFRGLEYHLLQTTEANLGIIHLEEGKRRFYDGIVGYELKTAAHHDPYLTPEEKFEAWQKASKRDNRLHFYSHFSSDDPDAILDSIRFMAGACECKFIFLDHITMLVSGSADGDERRVLDYISTKLAGMVEELNFCLFMISHENDDGKTRGSRNISKISDLWVQLVRNLEATDPIERNTTHLMVKKNRFAAVTGPGGALYFDKDTYMINERPVPQHGMPPTETSDGNH
jgi:twinkle protein